MPSRLFKRVEHQICHRPYEEVEFYLRGEEYSEQVDHFVKAVQGKFRTSKIVLKVPG